MKFVLALLGAVGVADGVAAQDFYAGAALGSLSTTSGGVDGDGTTASVFVGYRFPVSGDLYGEVEGTIGAVDGETDTGLTDFDDSLGLSFGLGTYFTEVISGSAHIGYFRLNSTNTTVGALSDTGVSLGLQVGYDVTPKDSIALRFNYYDTSNDFDDGTGRELQLRYSRRF